MTRPTWDTSSPFRLKVSSLLFVNLWKKSRKTNVLDGVVRRSKI